MINIIKRLFGIQTPVSLLALNMWHFNNSTWLERVIAHGNLDQYLVKHW